MQYKMLVNGYCIINFAQRVCTGYTEGGYSPPYNIATQMLMTSWGEPERGELVMLIVIYIFVL